MSNISRSVFQKVKEENKRLLNDIKSLVGMNRPEDESRSWSKWREYFEKEKRFKDEMKELAKQLLPKK